MHYNKKPDFFVLLLLFLKQHWQGFIMAQIGQSAVIKVNDGVTEKWKIDSAKFFTFWCSLACMF